MTTVWTQKRRALCLPAVRIITRGVVSERTIAGRRVIEDDRQTSAATRRQMNDYTRLFVLRHCPTRWSRRRVLTNESISV